MRIYLVIFLLILIVPAYGQEGYVKLSNDSVITGFLKPYKSMKDGQPGYEVWRTKRDRKPLKVPKATIKEYAIKSDTFKIFRQYRPFPSERIYYEAVDAKIELRGKISLYKIERYRHIPTGGVTIIIDERIYVLEDEDESLRALPRDKDQLKEVLLEFFPEKHLDPYAKRIGGIAYDDIPKIVKSFRSSN